MRIHLTSVFRRRPASSSRLLHTEVLGFIKRRDVPLGSDSWLTVVSPESSDGPELLLEPSSHPAVKPYRDALAEDGIPLAQFAVDDVRAEHERLTGKGVMFTHDRHRHRRGGRLRRHLRQPHPAHRGEARSGPPDSDTHADVMRKVANIDHRGRPDRRVGVTHHPKASHPSTEARMSPLRRSSTRVLCPRQDSNLRPAD
ncbi:VOC family protein [Nocardioides sp.]|uniref:VOC family protein n=1 Tax=Nocardioides sp. TaxID=35761 RepID=UPI0031FE66C9